MSEKNNSNNFLAGVLIGSAVGATLALVFAPKPGKELRSDINQGTQKALEKAGDWKDTVQEKSTEYAGIAKEKGIGLKEKGSELTKKVTEMTKDIVKDVSDKTKDVAKDVSDKTKGVAKDVNKKTQDVVQDISVKAKKAKKVEEAVGEAIEEVIEN